MRDDFKIVKRKNTLYHSQNDTVKALLPELPKELIDEILARLPVRTLLQFKCVCKSWNTRISDPEFTKTHLRISTAKPLLVGSINGEIISYPVKPLLKNLSTPVEPVIISSTMHGYYIIGSYNGLLCLYDVLHSNFILWNPSINLKSKTSPTIGSSYSQMKCYGFGYDHINDKYKVLVDVFPSYPLKFKFGFYVLLGKFVSGTLNWIVYKNGGNSHHLKILSFDLEKEIYGEMLFPQRDDCWNCELYVFRNYLCVCYNHSNENHWGVWMMKQYGVAESWTKLMIIPYEKLLNYI